jgi:hypothetical protein
MLSITACSNNPEDFSHLFESKPDIIEPYPIGKPVSTPAKITTLYENPIVIESIKEGDYSKVRISGLKNKQVEAEINNRIDELFEKMTRYVALEEIPPYHGLASKFDTTRKFISRSCDVYVAYNYNNILTISASVEIYDHVNNEYISFHHEEALTLDLNTGKPIALSQLFGDDTNWKTAVNEEVNAFLTNGRADDESNDSYYIFPSNVLLIKPFGGIEDTFNYKILYHQIHLIFDYDDSEFYTADGSITIPLNMNNLVDLFAISERFISDDYLYENEITNIVFFSPFNSFVDREEGSETIDGREWYKNTYSTVDNERIESKCDDLVQSIYEEIQQTIEEKPDYLRIYEHRGLTQIGPYVNFNMNIGMNSDQDYFWSDYSYVFDELGNPLSIDDLFTDTYDYETLLKDAIKKSSREQQVAMTEDQVQSLFEGLMFQIHTDALYFITPPLQRTQNEFAPVSMYLEFKEIGIKNLDIFY